MNVSPDLHAATPYLTMIQDIGAPMFIIRAEPGGTYRYAGVNDAMLTMSGFAREQLIGATPFDVLPRRLATTMCGKYADCLADGAPQRFEMGFAVRGRERWVQMSLTPIAPQGRGARFILCTLADFTEIKQRLFASYTRRAQLERQYEDLKVLASVTAHDMRGPMGNVRHLVDLVLDGFKDLGDDKAMMIAKCGEVADHALTQLDVIMSHARTLDAASATHGWLDFGALCESLCALADPEGRVAITYPQARVRVDEILLQSTLRRLLDTACRYCRDTVDIEIAPSRKQPGLLVVDLRDDGPALAAVQWIDGAKPRGGPDRGTGLSALRAQLECRGGGLTMNALGTRGTRLRFLLPGRIDTDGAAPVGHRDAGDGAAP